MEAFFCPCPIGLETSLSAELESLGLQGIVVTGGGIGWLGTLEQAMQVNLYSRIASRVLWLVGRGDYGEAQDVYAGAVGLHWEEWLTASQTIRVDTHAHLSPLKSLDFVTLRVKDALCDRLREQGGSRPSVDTRNPDHRIFVYLTDSRYNIYLDTTGSGLFRRGQRPERGIAPLKKNLAAGLLSLAGWSGQEPLLDPFCGTGTILMEAADIARHRAPGLGRSFAFQKIQNWPLASWKLYEAEAEASVRPLMEDLLWGYDGKGGAVAQAQLNAEVAGYSLGIGFKQVNFRESKAPAPSGCIITNPPYGVRLGEQDQLAQEYVDWGDVLKQKYAGWRAYFLTADRAFERKVRLRVSKRMVLKNGDLDCRLYEIVVRSGSYR